MTKEITPKDLTIGENNTLFPPVDDESRLLLGCRRADYSASLIARAVEDCNAQVLNLNVTSLSDDSGQLIVALRVNHRNTEAITRSLMRYGYEVLCVESPDPAADESLRARAAELLRLLEL